MKYLLLLLLIISLAACASKRQVTDISKLKKQIELQKGPCFGSCPIYTLTVYEGAVLSFEGKRFTDKLGLHTRIMDKQEYKNLINSFEKADLWQYPDEFQNDIPDLPSTTISYYQGDRQKRISWKRGSPEVLQNLAKTLEKLGEAPGWKSIPQKELGDNSLNSDIIHNEIIVQLEEGLDVRQWALQFGKQDMKVKKRIAPNLSMWVVEYDIGAAIPRDMLKWIKDSKGVVNAEFNKKLSNRK